MSDPLQSLFHRVGRYGGHGINHEDEPFYGELDLHSLLDGTAAGIKYRATGIDMSLLHDERTWIAPIPEGGLALWTLNTHASTVLRHELIADRESPECERILVFRLGDPADRSILRNQVTLELFRDGRLGYKYAWGRPGEAFDDRSAVSMSLQGSTPAGVSRR